MATSGDQSSNPGYIGANTYFTTPASADVPDSDHHEFTMGKDAFGLEKLSEILKETGSAMARIGGNSTGADVEIGTNDAFGFRIETNGSVVMDFKSSGRVGINNFSPSARLEVNGDEASGVIRATQTSGTRVFVGTQGDSSFELQVDGTGNRVNLLTTTVGDDLRISSSGDSEKGFTIDTSGHTVPSVTESYNLGSATFEWDNIYSQNAVTVSDERRKENIAALSGCVDFVKALEPKSFTYKDSIIPAVAEKLDGDGNVMEAAKPERTVAHSRPHYGFIAQEVKAAMTSLGIADWAGYGYDEDADVHNLRLSEFIGIAFGAIKELEARVSALEA